MDTGSQNNTVNSSLTHHLIYPTFSVCVQQRSLLPAPTVVPHCSPQPAVLCIPPDTPPPCEDFLFSCQQSMCGLNKLFYCYSAGLCQYISYFRCTQTAFSYGQQMRLCAFSCLGTYWRAVVLQYTTTTLHIEGIIASASYLETPQEILVSCKRTFFYAHTHIFII